jgi:hypothetical protein
MSKIASFSSVIRPAITVLTVVFFFGVIAAGLWTNKVGFDKVLDILSGIWGMVVGYWYAKRENNANP